MSLRLRLTLLITGILCGVLVLFSGVVYGVVSVIQINQMDNVLTNTANEIISKMRVNAVGDINVLTLPPLDTGEITMVQVWGRDGNLRASSTNISRLTTPLDSDGLQQKQLQFRDTTVDNANLRVLTVPLEVGDRQVAVLQVGVSRSLIDAALRSLLKVLGAGTLVALLAVGLLGWFSIGRALAPLETVTRVATQITNADDLSRRIPLTSSRDDEVGQLIQAFNQTLSRLETLFTSQRRFLADVSHELRTPLTVIKGNVGLIRRFGEADEESLTSIESEVDRLTRMVGDLLLLAQAESGKLPLDMHPVELDTVLLEVYQQMSVVAGDRVELHLSDIDQIQVMGDRDRLKQVMLNLVGNAITYTPAGGQVYLTLTRSDQNARLIVRDTGPGIAAEDLPHVFERFYRAEKSRKRGGSNTGFGLGLSIAYWIVNNHGGHIEVNSKEGQGTSFVVWLPLLEMDKPQTVKNLPAA
ncbi:MAG: HAMP domain-containing sensor histidine kinase [Anaerolineaceae bacterium]